MREQGANPNGDSHPACFCRRPVCKCRPLYVDTPMNLEARSANCFATEFVLKLNGQAVGKFETRWFGEGLDIAMTGRRQLRFEKIGWMGSQFALKREGDERPVAWADRAGFLTSAWDLELSSGAAQLVTMGWFQTGYRVEQERTVLGQVDRLGWCERGWIVNGETLTQEDMILVGMIYHAILQRQTRRHSAAAGGHAGT
jgi:hypothetical protein